MARGGVQSLHLPHLLRIFYRLLSFFRLGPSSSKSLGETGGADEAGRALPKDEGKEVLANQPGVLDPTDGARRLGSNWPLFGRHEWGFGRSVWSQASRASWRARRGPKPAGSVDGGDGPWLELGQEPAQGLKDGLPLAKSTGQWGRATPRLRASSPSHDQTRCKSDVDRARPYSPAFGAFQPPAKDAGKYSSKKKKTTGGLVGLSSVGGGANQWQRSRFPPGARIRSKGSLITRACLGRRLASAGEALDPVRASRCLVSNDE